MGSLVERFDCCGLFIFFFQAEDGIRDAQESRGLGDVYKRQGGYIGKIPEEQFDSLTVEIFKTLSPGDITDPIRAVSYTHLTLPTIYSV